MNKKSSYALTLLLSAAFALAAFVAPSNAHADAAAKLEKESREALTKLYESSPSSKLLGDNAKAILVFPTITKGGFIVGGQYGKGTLFINDAVSGYYETAGASVGFQAGLEKFGYALFLMDDAALQYLRKSEGWEIGAGPTVTIVDQGLAASLSTTTAREGVYAFFFEPRGLMAGMSLQGTKVSKLDLD